MTSDGIPWKIERIDVCLTISVESLNVPNPSRLRCSKSICSDDTFCLPVTFTPGNETASMSTWIHEICVRVAFSTRRKNRRRREEIVAAPPDTGLDAEQDTGIAAREDRALLQTLLDSLDETHRQIVVLHEIERLPMREVAEIVGCPLQTAYSRCKAALEKMRSGLARDGAPQ